MKESRRVQRVEKELQHIVAQYLIRGFKGQLFGLVSVSRVESNPKLRTAKVYVSVLGSEDDKHKTIESLQEWTQDIQNQVNRGLQMKFVPRISIVLDEGLERLLKVETALREIAKDQEAREASKKSTTSSEDE
jgi:ribosome-binding factor A